MKLVSVYVDKIKQNEDKCRCEYKELIDKGVCDKGYVWNPSNCECECDKSCNIGEYLDYSDCKCRKKVTDPLVEECTENIDETSLDKIKIDAILMRYIWHYFGHFSYSF